MKKFAFAVVLILIIFFYGRSLNPFSQQMFDFHDITQPARIQEFTLNLQHFNIPPRLAPDLSFRLGYPVFNFYAPASYWIAGTIHLFGIDAVNTLKIVFLLAIVVAFAGTYLFLSHYYSWSMALLGGVLYISSLYIPVSIFVRGNLGELWFMALLPLAFHAIQINNQKKSRLVFFSTVIILSLLFTSHNILSLVAIPFCVIFVLLQKNKKKNLIALFLSLLLTSYFFLPLAVENSLTYAKTVATATKYGDHFLCWWQLWQSPWGYGGSAPGCFNDGMSFKIGKIQVVFGILGLISFLFFHLQRNKKKNEPSILHSLFFILLTLGSLFMTTYQSQFIWDALSPVFSLFQFPWRFIAFSLIGIVFLSSFFMDSIKLPFKNLCIGFIILLLFTTTTRYFYKTGWSKAGFASQYLSEAYVEQKAAYDMAEYLPKTADYTYWRTIEKSGLPFDYKQPAVSSPAANLQTLKNQTFYKEFFVQAPAVTAINMHYFPFWKIISNDSVMKPTQFDQLGRPVFTISEPSTIQIMYEETPVEKISDAVSIFSFLIVLVILLNRKVWNRLSN